MISNKKNITILTLFLVMLVFFFNCDESITRNECKDYDDVSLVVKGEYTRICDEVKDSFPAIGASIAVFAGDDTLFGGNLYLGDGDNAIYETGQIENSACGLTNVTIQTSYMGETRNEHYEMLCCDTTLYFLFNDITCEVTEVMDCSTLNQSKNLVIETAAGCVFWNAEYTQLSGNHFMVNCPNDIRFTWGESLLRRDQKIWIEAIVPDVDGNSVDIEAGHNFEIYFNVDVSEIGVIDAIPFSLTANCIKEDGSLGEQGIVEINVSAEICDPNDCACPFSEEVAKKYYADDPVPLGQSISNQRFEVMNITSALLGDGCELELNSITRADGSDAFSDHSTHSWVVDNLTPAPGNTRLKVGDDIVVNSTFTPLNTGEIIDTFVVTATTYSEASPNDAKGTCSFMFMLQGRGCEDSCPMIQVLSSNQAYLLDDLDTIREIDQLEEMVLNFDSVIYQTMDVRPKFNCSYIHDDFFSDGELEYKINMQDDYCKKFEYVIEAPASEHYSVQSLNDIIRITFKRPAMSEVKENFDYSFNIIQTNGSCRQKIKVSAEIPNLEYNPGDEFILEAYSQTTPKQEDKTLHIFDLMTTGDNENFGSMETDNDQNLGYNSDGSYNPPKNHTFYFEVDKPGKEDYGVQNPELYLVDSDRNPYKYITATPVAKYSSTSEFYENYNAVVDGLMDGSLYGKSGNVWTPNRSTENLVFPNGLELEEDGVYAMWTEDFSGIVDGDATVYCGLALLYVKEIDRGAVNGEDDLASVVFRVMYPIFSVQ